MREMLKSFIQEEDGLGTVEIVVIIAVLLGIALIFRQKIFDFVTSSLNTVFGNDKLDDSFTNLDQ